MKEHEIIDQALETIFSLMTKRLKTKTKESGEEKTQIEKGMRNKDKEVSDDAELLRPLLDPDFDKAPVEMPKPKRVTIVIGKKQSDAKPARSEASSSAGV